jgi:hypothetical protein
MSSHSLQQKLALLDFAGVAVNEDGHLTNHTGHPIIDERPDEDRKRSHRIKFTEEDDIVLATWLARAAAEGVSLKGSKFWDTLERTVCSTPIRSLGF